MYDLAHLTNSHLKDTVGRWIRNHTARQVLLVLLGFLAPVGKVCIAILIALHHHRHHTCLCARCRVRSMSRSRNQQDIAMVLTFLVQILAYSHQSRILASRTRSRLQVACRKTRDSSQLLLQVFHHFHVSSHLLCWRQWVNTHIARIGHRNHSRCWVEFHGARAQWNHRMRQTNILAVKAFDIAHHLGLGTVFLEHFFLQVIHLANTIFVDSPQSLKGLFAILVLRHIARCVSKHLNQVVHIVYSDRLIQTDSNPTLLVIIEVNAQLFSRFVHCLYPILVANLQRIKELRVFLLIAVCLQHLAQIHRLTMNTFGYLTNTLCAMIYTVHTCHHSRQGFCGTDIRRRFLAFDMLLSCLKCQTESWLLVGIFTQTNDTTWHIAFVLLASCHVSCGRTTKAHWQTKALCCTAHDICFQRLEQCQCHQVSNHRHFHTSCMADLNECMVILYRAVCIRPLHDSAKERTMLCQPIASHASIIHQHKFDILPFRACAHYM